VAWDKLMGGEAVREVIQTEAIKTMGRIKFDVSFTAETRYLWREERFTFVSSMELDVEAGGGLTINQTINTTGQGGGSDTVYAPIRLESSEGPRRREASQDITPLALLRGTKLERATGVRGYQEGPLAGAALARNARFVWRGFPDGEVPPNGPIANAESLLHMGRSKLRAEGGEGHVRLLIRDAQGKVDENMSRAVSRRHIDLYIQRGRLMVLAASDSGVQVGEERLANGREKILQDGDIIHILPKYADQLSLQVRMTARHDEISEIMIVRQPALNGDGSR
jgi:hypothetical protein